MTDYILIRAKRKTVSLSINDDLTPVVKAPRFVSKREIDSFVRKHESWIASATEKKKAQLERTNISEEEIKELISKAKIIIPEKVEYYSRLMNLRPTGVKITRAKKRYGSCSGKNSLCFSCFLMQQSDEAIDYVVVHELAHIKHHNHSKAFYELISLYLPDYKEREKMLKK